MTRPNCARANIIGARPKWCKTRTSANQWCVISKAWFSFFLTSVAPPSLARTQPICSLPHLLIVLMRGLGVGPNTRNRQILRTVAVYWTSKEAFLVVFVNIFRCTNFRYTLGDRPGDASCAELKASSLKRLEALHFCVPQVPLM